MSSRMMNNTEPTDWPEMYASTRKFNGPSRWDPYPTRRGFEWRLQAACADFPVDEFYSEPNGGDEARDSLIRAMLLCGHCPVRKACLEDAILEEDRWAVRGGTTPWHRGSTTKHAARQRGIPTLSVILACESDLRAGRTWEEIQARNGVDGRIVSSLSRVTGIAIAPTRHGGALGLRVREALGEVIDELNDGDPLPVAFDLAERVGCSRSFLRKIVLEMISEGRLERPSPRAPLRVIKREEEKAA